MLAVGAPTRKLVDSRPMPRTLQTFSQSLLRLVSLARNCGPEKFMPVALTTVQAELGFRSVWWGWVNEPEEAGAPPRVQLSGSLGLAEGFAEEWAEVADCDQFALGSITAPGSVVRFSADATVAPSMPLQHFAKRHDLFHLMALTAPESTSGMMFFFAAYRGIADAPFSEADAILFGEFAQHLLLLTQQMLREVLVPAADDHAEGVGLVSAQGSPLFLGCSLCAQIAMQWPGWDGHALPADLQVQLAAAPCVMPVGSGTVEIRAHGDRYLLRLTSEQAPALLAPRQRRVAVLYATGCSYKEIARILSLSPATVRTYLRDCYARLGVSNRIALSSALDKATMRARAKETAK